MHRRAFLASVLAGLATACSSRHRKLHAARDRVLIGHDLGAPDGDTSSAVIVSIPPRYAMSSHVRLHAMHVEATDPDAWLAKLHELRRGYV